MIYEGTVCKHTSIVLVIRGSNNMSMYPNRQRDIRSGALFDAVLIGIFKYDSTMFFDHSIKGLMQEIDDSG